MKNIVVVMVLMSISSLSVANEMYRAPASGDSGAYYLLSSNKVNNEIFKVLTSRVGKGNAYTDFTELKVNCKSKQYFELAGGSEDGEKKKPSKPLKDWSSNSKWTSLVVGSSKYDLVNYVCKKFK